jgi:hypothetical protein
MAPNARNWPSGRALPVLQSDPGFLRKNAVIATTGRISRLAGEGQDLTSRRRRGLSFRAGSPADFRRVLKPPLFGNKDGAWIGNTLDTDVTVCVAGNCSS